MFQLSEDGIIPTDQVIKLSGDGSLWIVFQYIDKGLLDIVEADLRRDVVSRDFYGFLFENTRLTLDRLLEISEDDRVISTYRAAISHRLKALKSEASTRDNSKEKRDARNSSAKWVKHYLPAIKKIVSDYRDLLDRLGRSDPELDAYEKAIHALKPAK